MIAQLLTPLEVIKYTNLPADYPPCEIREANKIVFTEFLRCFGIDFYNHIVSKLAVYAANSYIIGQTYVINDVVSYNGVLWKCTAISTTDVAGHSNSWILAPKFTDECLNEFWCDYLASYLSWVVRENKEPFWFYESKKVKSEGYVANASSTSLLSVIMSAIRKNIASEFLIIDKYLRDNKTQCGFNKYLPNQQLTDACGCDIDNSCVTSKMGNSESYEFY